MNTTNCTLCCANQKFHFLPCLIQMAQNLYLLIIGLMGYPFKILQQPIPLYGGRLGAVRTFFKLPVCPEKFRPLSATVHFYFTQLITTKIKGMRIDFIDGTVAYVSEDCTLTMLGITTKSITRCNVWGLSKYISADTSKGRFTELVRFCKVFNSIIKTITPC